MNKTTIDKNDKKARKKQQQFIFLFGLKNMFLIIALLALFFIIINSLILNILFNSLKLSEDDKILIFSLIIFNIFSILCASFFLVRIIVLKNRNILKKYKVNVRESFLLFWFALLIGSLPNLIGFILISKSDLMNYESMFFIKRWYENWMKIVLLLTFDFIVIFIALITLSQTNKMFLIKQKQEEWMNQISYENENNIIQLMTAINPNYTKLEMNKIKRFTPKYVALNLFIATTLIATMVLINITAKNTIFQLFQWLPTSILIAQVLYSCYNYFIQFQLAKEKSKNVLQKNINIFSRVTEVKGLRILDNKSEPENLLAKVLNQTPLFKKTSEWKRRCLYEEKIIVSINDVFFCIDHKIWANKSTIAISHDFSAKKQSDKSSIMLWFSEILSLEEKDRINTYNMIMEGKNFVVNEIEFSERNFTEFDKKTYFLVYIIAAKIFDIAIDSD